MNLMKQLMEEITEDDELEDWAGEFNGKPVSLSNKFQNIEPENWYNGGESKATSRFPQHHSTTYDLHYADAKSSRPPVFHGVQSIDMNDSSQDEESDRQPYMKSSTSFGDTADTSNIHHYNIVSSEATISTSILSDKAQSIFKFKSFNKMQSKSFKSMYEEPDNCVISSPTGSGKTVLFELAILKLLDSCTDSNTLKILYIAPTKSLCLERERDWTSKFSSYGLTVGALTSDTSFFETDKVKRANIIITTPEKWDLMTRKWADYTKLFKLIKLLLVDEIHILRDNRGSTLEVVVTRMKKICNPIRIIALSATVPNIQDVSGWIKLNSQSEQNAVTLVFGDEYRPVKLEKFVYGYKQTMNDFVFDTFLNSKLAEILRKHSNNKPVLIFCPTRNSTISTAKYLSKNLVLHLGNQNLQAAIKDKELRELSLTGFSYHHAGLSLSDRLSVEKNFLNGNTRVLCSTSTLAVGVNLPAYLVVLKGTKAWTGVAFEEYSDLDILQMMGRAGRPQFETQGQAVLMTGQEKQLHYEKLVKGNEKLESRLHLNLSENLVPEIYLKTVKSVEGALEWLKLTFFYARYRSNPTAYDEVPHLKMSDPDTRLLRYTESKLRELTDFKLIEIVNGEYRCTQFGNAMTKHYILFDTMKMYVKSSSSHSISDIIELVSKSSEFSNIRLKRAEKKLFKELNDSPILKYPIKTNNKASISSNHEKISILIQYELGGLEYPNSPDFYKLQQSFKQDKFFVLKHIGRLVRCMIDCFLEKGDFISLVNCLQLSRCLNGKCWEDSSIVLRQLEGVGIAAVRRFSNQNIKSFEEVKNLSTSTIEYYLNQKPGFGSKILREVSGLPSLSVETHLVTSKAKKESIMVTVRMNMNCQMHSKFWHGKSVTVNVVSGLSSGELVDFRRARLSNLNGVKSFTFEFVIQHKNSTLISSISCEEIAGVYGSYELNLQSALPQNQLDGLRMYSKTDEEDLEGDEEEFNELLVEATNSNKVPSKSQPQKDDEDREQLPNNSLACKHTCKDKASCRHLCCREGIAPKPVKRPKNKETEDDHNPKKSQKLLGQRTEEKAVTSKTLRGYSLLNRLHEKSSPNNSHVETVCVSKYKYFEPDLYAKEKGANSLNNSKTNTTADSSSVDVIGLLREARNKGRETAVVNVEDNDDYEDDGNNSSVIMVDEPLFPKRKDTKPAVNVPVYHKTQDEDDLWSGNDLNGGGQQADSIHFEEAPNTNYQPSNLKHADDEEPASAYTGNNVAQQIDDALQYFSQDSIGDLGDLLGSDVEIV